MTDRSDDQFSHDETDNTALWVFSSGMLILGLVGLLKGILWLVGQVPM